MIKKILFSIYFFILICFGTTAFAASVAGDVKEGNRLFREEKLDEAIEKYSKAKVESPDSDIVNFNLGTAQYKKGAYKEALESFIRALSTDDRQLEAKATYNMANTKYKMGSMQAGQNPGGAASLYREALDYYKRAMELDREDRDAKFNHELVERELKVLLDRMKNQQDQDHKGGVKEPRSDNSQQKQQQQQRGKEQDDMSGGSEEKWDKGESPSLSEETLQEQEADSKEGERAAQMSSEEARMLLESYGQEEAREEVNRQMRGRVREVIRDW